mmetsp:Transcript_33912/g.33017  ORF Transcript_33912/g.33017 Transcript_33912/m.33017 type:complete len:309 (-) Transcript_33912:1071-1997(-)
MGFYFAFLMFYTSQLLIPAVPGLALFGYQLKNIWDQYSNDEQMSLDNEYLPIYCILLALWSTVMIELWKRREHEIQQLWNMANYKGKDEIRKEFEAVFIPKHADKTIVKESFQNTYLRRVSVEIPLVIISLSITVALYGLIQNWRRNNEEGENSTVIDYTASAINSVIMVILSFTYRIVSKSLTNWENHKGQVGWENSLTTKIFAFSFVNSYITLFYYAFVEQDYNEVAIQLIFILMAKQIGVNMAEVLLPWAKNKYYTRKLNKKIVSGEAVLPEDPVQKEEQLFIEKQLINEKGSNVLIDRYNEMVL